MNSADDEKMAKRTSTNKRILKWFGAAVAVLVIIGVIGAVFGEDDTDTSDDATSSQSSEKSKGDKKSADKPKPDAENASDTEEEEAEKPEDDGFDRNEGEFLSTIEILEDDSGEEFGYAEEDRDELLIAMGDEVCERIAPKYDNDAAFERAASKYAETNALTVTQVANLVSAAEGTLCPEIS